MGTPMYGNFKWNHYERYPFSDKPITLTHSFIPNSSQPTAVSSFLVISWLRLEVMQQAPSFVADGCRNHCLQLSRWKNHNKS